MDMDWYQHKKWDPDPFQIVPDPPHCFIYSTATILSPSPLPPPPLAQREENLTDITTTGSKVEEQPAAREGSHTKPF